MSILAKTMDGPEPSQTLEKHTRKQYVEDMHTPTLPAQYLLLWLTINLVTLDQLHIQWGLQAKWSKFLTTGDKKQHQGKRNAVICFIITSSLNYQNLLSWALMADGASQGGVADSSWTPGLISSYLVIGPRLRFILRIAKNEWLLSQICSLDNNRSNLHLCVYW